MNETSLNFLSKIIKAISPSGFEAEAIKIWKDRTKDFADKVESDIHGNGIAIINANKKPKIMLAGHIDEVGYMITYIDKEGYLYFSTIGGIDPHIIPGKRVLIKTKKGDILGVVGRKPIHSLEEPERSKVAKIEQLWIDIGAKDEKEAKSLVEIGDSAVSAQGLEKIGNNNVIGRGFDDKAGAFAVSETLRLLKGKKVKASVYGVATVQEEIGLRGARTSAYSISPDIGIAIDVTFATDFPGMDKKQIGDIKIGGGPVIARGPNINPKIFELMVATAKEEKIPYQIEGISRATGTDANVIQLNQAGVATGLISIPLRYMHTPVELLNLDDLENTAKLLSAFILRINEKSCFMHS